MRAMGATSTGAAALFAALSMGGADVEGRISGTGGISLAQQLRDFGPLKRYGTMTERIGALQGSKAMARQFIDSSSFEKKMLGPIEDLLLRPQSETAQAFKRNLEKIPKTEMLGQVADSMLDMFSLDPSDITASGNRRIKMLKDQEQIADSVGGALSNIDMAMEQMRNRTGMGMLGRANAWAAWQWSRAWRGEEGEMSIAEQYMQRRASELQADVWEGRRAGRTDAAQQTLERQLQYLEQLVKEVQKLNASANAQRQTTLAAPNRETAGVAGGG